jgi:HD-GYP domain-containing protein (c-di-GMP phosphodiesterase class II)
MLAAEYHDIGLLTFPTSGSEAAIREHARVGAGLLSSHPHLFEVARMVESHHERFDGSGQPHGKQGHELPLECWILALTEDFVEHWEQSLESYEKKVRDFFLGPAKHHHPDAVDALCGLVDAEKLQELL